MGTDFSSSLGDFVRDVKRQAVDMLHETAAQSVVETAREKGLTNADNIEISVDSDSGDPSMRLDIERVRAMANEMLAADD